MYLITYLYALREKIDGKSGSSEVSHKVFKSKYLGHMVSHAGHMPATTFTQWNSICD